MVSNVPCIRPNKGTEGYEYKTLSTVRGTLARRDNYLSPRSVRPRPHACRDLAHGSFAHVLRTPMHEH